MSRHIDINHFFFVLNLIAYIPVSSNGYFIKPRFLNFYFKIVFGDTYYLLLLILLKLKDNLDRFIFFRELFFNL